MEPRKLSTRSVFATWWPLAASWLMMGLELPLVSAVVARLVDPSIQLAAYGGIVFPISLLIEAPIIMILTASTVLCKDWDSFAKLRRFTVISAIALTAIHLLIAATPLFDFVVGRLIDAPQAIHEPARIGLLIMTPWTAAIAYRRFLQGVLIRFGRSRAVGIGTAVRLITILVLLGTGYLNRWSGIVTATVAVAAGVMIEALFAVLVSRPVLRGPLRDAKPVAQTITLRRLLAFYVPLAATPLFVIFAQPLASAAMSRMPNPIDSLAVWPVLGGFLFTFRSVGFAYNEVVVLSLETPDPDRALPRFTIGLAAVVTTILFLIAATPAARLWFANVSGLSPALVAIGASAIWIGVVMPGLSVFQALFMGKLVHAHKTRPVTEAVFVYIAVTSLVLAAGVRNGTVTGIYFGQLAMVAGNACQTLWLWFRGRRLGRVLPVEALAETVVPVETWKESKQ
ncbi:MAG: hypothetical protein HKN20_00015 [Gemmatimonadetes bacterium]|nr:hypothetical protein [Gemmatimonadota bacterium]